MATQLVVIGCEGILVDDDGEPLQAALEALARLTHAGHHVVVIAWLQRGKPGAAAPLDALGHAQALLQRRATDAGGVIDGFFVCPHAADDGCDCRPPRAGLFDEIAARWHVDLAGLPCALAVDEELHAAASVGAAAVSIGEDGDYPDLAAYAQSLLDDSTA